MRALAIAGLASIAAAVLIGAGWVALGSGAPRGGVAVLGDEAPALHEAMGTAQALPLHTAGVTVVSVQGWDRLRYIPDMADLCGQACSGDVGLVRVVRLHPGDTRKLVFVDLEAWRGTAGLARASEEKDFTCVAEAIRAEFARLGGGAVPECATDMAIAAGTRWVLPWGLGAF